MRDGRGEEERKGGGEGGLADRERGKTQSRSFD